MFHCEAPLEKEMSLDPAFPPHHSTPGTSPAPRVLQGQLCSR